MTTVKTDTLKTLDSVTSIDIDNMFDPSIDHDIPLGVGDIYFNNKAIISIDSNGWDGDRTGTNIDHIWHDWDSDEWNFCSDTTYKALGNSEVKVKEVLPESTTWVTPTLTNSWVDYGSSYTPVGYYKDADNTVFIRGLIKSGTIDAVAFTLPVGYRPDSSLIFASQNNDFPGRVDVRVDGTVLPRLPSTNTYVSVSISFKAAL